MKNKAKLCFVGVLVWLAASFCTSFNSAVFAAQYTPTSTPFLPNFSESTPVPVKVSLLTSQEDVEVAYINGDWEKEIVAVSEIIAQVSKPLALNPQLYAATIHLESYTNCPDGPVTMSCVSSSGAIGPAQVMPLHYSDGEDKTDLFLNLEKGAQILSSYIELTGSVRAGLAAYNCGPGNYDHQQCWDYADKVLEIFKQHVGHAFPNPG